ncbi:MAG: hypothetical protein ABSB76_04080 [Streptosporangiaceae bacterium]|jgi:hypothetical protein
MPDPIISAVAAAVAGKAAEAAMQAGQEACAALVRLVRDRLGRDKKAATALEAAGRHPEDEAALADLARALERLAAADGDFASRLRELWSRAAAELTVSQGSVVNSATGSVGGHLMQARDVQVEGGLQFGDVQRPAERQ